MLRLWWGLCVLVVGLGLYAADATSLAAPTAPVAAAALNSGEGDFVDRYLAVAEQIDPTLASQLRSMCQLDPERLGRVLKQLGPALSELVKLRDRDPELYRRKIKQLHMEATIESLATSIRSAEALGETVESASRVQLRALVEAQLADSLRTQQRELEQMRRALERAEKAVTNRRKHFSGEVDRRVEWLLTR